LAQYRTALSLFYCRPNERRNIVVHKSSSQSQVNHMGRRTAPPSSSATKKRNASSAAKKKKSGAASSSAAAAAAKKKNNNKNKKPLPSFFVCPETNDEVWITTASLEEIKRASKLKKRSHPFNAPRERKFLIKICSPTVRRRQAYDRSASALRELEERLLPEYGGRSWQVRVDVKDPLLLGKPTSPFFVFHKGRPELAAWPHLVAKIPDPPRFPGYSKAGADVVEEKKKERERERLRRRKQQQQQQREEREEEEEESEPAAKNEEEEEDVLADEDEDDDEEEDPALAAAQTKNEDPSPQSEREEQQQHHPQREEEVKETSEEQEEEEEEKISSRNYGDASGKQVEKEEEEDGSDGEGEGGASSAASVAAEDEDGREEEEGSEEQDSEEEDDSEDDSEEEDEEESVSDEQQELNDFLDREESSLSRMAYRERGRVPLPIVTVKWISPLRQIFHSRKSAYENAVALCRNEVLLDKQLRGLGATGQPIKVCWPSKKQSLATGAIRFERDGLWVVGQDEQWQRERLLEEAGEKEEEAERQRRRQEEEDERKRPPVASPKGEPGTGGDASSSEAKKKRIRKPCHTPLEYYLIQNRRTHSARRLKELKNASKSTLVRDLVVAPSADCGAVVVVGIPGGNRAADAESATNTDAAASSSAVAVVTPAKSAIAAVVSGEEKKEESDSDAEGAVGDVDASKPPAAVPPADNHASAGETEAEGTHDDKNKPNSNVVSFTLRDADKELRVKWKALSKSEQDMWAERCRKYVEQQRQSQIQEVVTSSENQTTTKSFSTLPAADVVKSSCVDERKPPASEKTQSLAKTAGPRRSAAAAGRPESTHWRLNAKQIELCYRAGMDHYDQIMRTVQMRDLTRELQDGFNLFRERGRGRYDMELPCFDDDERFSFLTDLSKTPWMPVVQEILGQDATLIHKGMFLSMPGAERQDYHQDGVHLTQQYQKACHAINVFVPLVDLTPEHGPTEFCLGSHILGQEDYDEDRIETPLVKAGCPIVFDYRLGHRGMANASPDCRPILYCTYARASDGKEFRDSINFSRRRYHQLGDLIVERGLTREERAKKRQRLHEEYWPEGGGGNNDGADDGDGSAVAEDEGVDSDPADSEDAAAAAASGKSDDDGSGASPPQRRQPPHPAPQRSRRPPATKPRRS